MKEANIEKLKLKPANGNIWYALATIEGEPTAYNDPVIEKNCYFWNGCMRDNLSQDTLEKLKDEAGNNNTLPTLSEEDKKQIQNTLNERGFKDQPIVDAINKVNFSNTLFKKLVSFDGYLFAGDVSFQGSVFSTTASFNNTVFLGVADYQKVTFMNFTQFKGAKFADIAAFNNVNSKVAVLFSDVIFTYSPPTFFGALISGMFVWTNATFPSPYHLTRIQTDMYKTAYENLASIVSELKKHHDRHMFWRHEMRLRRQLDRGWRKFPAKAMNWLYDKSCDYGYGFGRALGLWCGHIVAGAILIFTFTNHSWTNAVNSFVTSFSNAHSFLGLNRGPLEKVYEGYAGEGWFNALWTFQAIFGVMFLFFLILTIRNRFKMG